MGAITVLELAILDRCMEDNKKSKVGWLVAAGLAVAGVVSVASAGTAPVAPVAAPIQAPIVQEIDFRTKSSSEIKPVVAPAEEVRDSGLSNNNYYTNVDGNSVHAPAYSESSCSAVGASAECRDGTCSFSQNRRGTCSHHGGVAEWL